MESSAIWPFIFCKQHKLKMVKSHAAWDYPSSAHRHSASGFWEIICKSLLLYNKSQCAWARYVFKPLQHWELKTDFQQIAERHFCNLGTKSLLNFRFIHSNHQATSSTYRKATTLSKMYAFTYLRTIPHFLIKLSDNVQILPNAEYFNTGGNSCQSTSIWKRLFGTEMLPITQVLLQVDIIRIFKDRNEFTLLTLTYIPI